jgi:hypothetical protein
MYDKGELTLEACELWAKELPEDELQEKINDLPRWDREVELVHLSMQTIAPNVAEAFARLANVIGSPHTVNLHVRIDTSGGNPRILRDPTGQELLDAVALREHNRRLSANRKEEKDAEAEAAQPAAEVVK